MLDDRTATRPERKMSFRMYKQMKKKMLVKDFCITLTKEESDRFDSLKTETQVDQFCIGILNNRW